MSLERFQDRWETLESEQLKTAAEFSLHSLARFEFGERLITLAAGGERIESPRLHTEIGGLLLENPVMVGAGWDKKGWAVDGLYRLGFSGTEVGSVLVHPQAGNPRPRLFYDDGVGLNRLGFNSKGMEAVAVNLEKQDRPGIVGISIGKNKLTPDDQAPWAHAAVAEHLHAYADYFVINVSSPNTPGLRDFLKPERVEELVAIIQAVNAVLETKGSKPLFVKISVDLSTEDLDKVIETCLANSITGLIDSNTTIDEQLKAQYGWQDQKGGLSGDDAEYRQRASERMRYITRTTLGTDLQRIGVGAINSAGAAIERMEAGAQAVQVVTAIRQHKGKVARDINVGILERLDRDGIDNVQEIIGASV